MAFHEYFKVFIKLFIDDFSIFSDFKLHLAKLQLCFDKCRKFDISLKPKKCMFLVYSRVILGHVVSKARKSSDPKKISIIVNMPSPKTPKHIQVFNGMAQFYRCFIKNVAFIMAPITKLLCKIEVFAWTAKF